jgi:solute carrier family 25 (peroxisomal adenine nucleotide transporter), member 17
MAFPKFSFFYFYFYSFLRSLSMRGPQSLPLLRNTHNGGAGKKIVHKPGMLEDIVLGYIAGVASRAVSSPFNIITLRLQAERADAEDEDALSDDSGSESSSSGRRSPLEGEEDTGPIGVARRIYQQEGWQGFWRGQLSAPGESECC